MSEKPTINQRLFEIKNRQLRMVTGAGKDGKSFEVLIDSGTMISIQDVALILNVLIGDLYKQIRTQSPPEIEGKH